jgi:hypothetical protein
MKIKITNFINQEKGFNGIDLKEAPVSSVANFKRHLTSHSAVHRIQEESVNDFRHLFAIASHYRHDQTPPMPKVRHVVSLNK